MFFHIHPETVGNLEANIDDRIYIGGNYYPDVPHAQLSSIWLGQGDEHDCRSVGSRGKFCGDASTDQPTERWLERRKFCKESCAMKTRDKKQLYGLDYWTLHFSC